MNKKIAAIAAALAMVFTGATSVCAEEEAKITWDDSVETTLRYEKNEEKEDGTYVYDVYMTIPVAPTVVQFGFLAVEGEIVDFTFASGNYDDDETLLKNTPFYMFFKFGENANGTDTPFQNCITGANTDPDVIAKAQAARPNGASDVLLGQLTVRPSAEGKITIGYEDRLNIVTFGDGKRTAFCGANSTNSDTPDVVLLTPPTDSSSESSSEVSSETSSEVSSTVDSAASSSESTADSASSNTSSTSSNTSSTSSTTSSTSSTSSKAASTAASKASTTTNPNDNKNTGAASTAIVGMAALSAALVVVSKKRK